MRGAILLAALLVGGCASARAGTGSDDAAEMAAALVGRTAGTPRTCIGITQTSSPRIIGDSLLYDEGRRLWVSATVGGCPSLRGDAVTIVEVHGAQLCANDRFRTIQRGGIGIPGPYCRFGPFVPYERPRS